MENDKKIEEKKTERNQLDAQINQHLLLGKDIKEQLNALAAKAGITNIDAFMKEHAEGGNEQHINEEVKTAPLEGADAVQKNTNENSSSLEQELQALMNEMPEHQANIRTEVTRALLNLYRKMANKPPFTGSITENGVPEEYLPQGEPIGWLKGFFNAPKEFLSELAQTKEWKREVARRREQSSENAPAKENKTEAKTEPALKEETVSVAGDTADKANPAFDSLVKLLRQTAEEEQKLELTEKLSSSLMSQQKKETAINKHQKKINGFKEKTSAIEKDLSPEEVKRARALAVPEIAIEAEEKKDAVVEKESEVHMPKIQPLAASPEEEQPISSNQPATAEKRTIDAVKEETTEPAGAVLLKAEAAGQMPSWEKYEAYKEQMKEHSRRYVQARDDLNAFFARADKEQMPDDIRTAERKEWQAKINAIQDEMKSWDKGPLDDTAEEKLYNSVYGETKIEMRNDTVEVSRTAYVNYLTEHKITKDSYVSKENRSLKEAYDRARVELGNAMLSAKHTELMLENTPSETLDQIIAEYKSTEIYQRVHVEEYAAMQEFKAGQLPTKRGAWFRKAMDKTLKLVAKPMALWQKAGDWGKEFKFRTGKDADGNPVYYKYRLGQLVRSGITGALFGAGIGSAAHFTVKLARGTVIAAGGGVALSKLQTAHEKTMRDIEAKREAAVQAYKTEDADLDAFEQTMETLDAEQTTAERKLRLKQIGIGALMGAANFAAVQAENAAFAAHIPGQTPLTRPTTSKVEQPISDQHLPKIESKVPQTGVASDAGKVIEQKGVPTVPVEQHAVVIPKEAIIDGKHTTGITWAMKYQFEKNPELAEKLGYTAAPNKAKFLAGYAKKLGYISEDNTEVRIAHVGGAYVINPDGSVTEYAPDGTAVETHVQGQPFNAAAIQKDQYLWTKNPMLKGHHSAAAPRGAHADAAPASEAHSSEAGAPVTSPRATFDQYSSSPASPTAGSPYETGVPASQEQLAAVASARTTASIDQLFGRRTFWGRVVPGERSDEWNAMRNVKMSTIMDTDKKSFPDAYTPKVVALRSFAKTSGVAPGTMSVEAYMKRVAEMEAQSASA
jgi:hypothetical protein